MILNFIKQQFNQSYQQKNNKIISLDIQSRLVFNILVYTKFKK